MEVSSHENSAGELCCIGSIFSMKLLGFVSKAIKLLLTELVGQCYLLTNWLAYLYGRIQSPRPDVMPDRREGITRAAGFGFACIDTQAS